MEGQVDDSRPHRLVQLVRGRLEGHAIALEDELVLLNEPGAVLSPLAFSIGADDVPGPLELLLVLTSKFGQDFSSAEQAQGHDQEPLRHDGSLSQERNGESRWA